MAATRRETIVAVVVFVGAVIALGVSVVTTGTYVLAAVLGIVTVVVVLCSYAVLMLLEFYYKKLSHLILTLK